MTEKELHKNLTVLYVGGALSGVITTIPIWVTFFTGILTFEQLATLYAVRYLVELLLELPTGAFADLFGKKISVGLGGVLQGIGCLLVAVSNTPLQVYTFMLIAEVGITLGSGAIDAWVFDSLKENGEEKRFSSVMSKSNLAFQLSIAVAILSGGYFYQLWTGLPWIIEGLAMAMSGLLIWFWGIEPKVDTEKFTLKNYIRQTRNGFKEIWKNSYVKNLTVFYMVVGGVTWSAQKFFNQIYATQIGYSDIEKSWLFSFIRILNALVLTRYLKSTRFFSRNKGLILFPVIFLVFFVPTLFAGKILGGLLLFGLTFANTAGSVILNQFTNEEFDSKVRATALSSLNMLVGLVYVIITYSSGFVLKSMGSGMFLGFVGIVAVIITTPLAWRLVKRG